MSGVGFKDGVAANLAPIVDEVIEQVRSELIRAINLHGSMKSPHEGWAVIQEESDELWETVKANNGRTGSAFAEAIQIAAMGARYVVDLRR